LRYLLAHDKRIARVTLNGVTFQVGKQKFNYRGREIAHLVGREVLAWFDPENPETIVVTNLDRTNPICVARSQQPHALDGAGTLTVELNRIEAQASHMLTRFNVVRTKFPLPQRQLLATAQVVELGDQINRGKLEHSKLTKSRQQQRRQAQRFMQRTGIAVPERAQATFQPDDAQFLSDFLEGET
jgi:Mu transposase, C-terminal